MQQNETNNSTREPNTSFPCYFKKVPASHGLLWLKQAFELIKINPGAWLLTSGLLLFLLILSSVIVPLLVFSPTLFAGAMLICHHLKTQRTFQLNNLFVGFKIQFNSLLISGIIYVAIILIVNLLTLEISKSLGFSEVILELTKASSEESSPAKRLILLKSMLPIIFIMLLLMLLATSAYWFVPALIIFKNCTPIKAIKLSFMASITNFVPFFIYSLFTFIITCVAFLLIALISMLLPALMSLLFLITFLLLYSLFLTSIYTSFVDIFSQENTTNNKSPLDDELSNKEKDSFLV